MALPTSREQRLQALVDHLVQQGGSVQAAGTRAGYATKQGAYAALSSELGQKMLLEASRKHLSTLGGEALKALAKLVKSARSEKVRLDAALAIIDRLGLSPDVPEPTQVTAVKVVIDMGGGGKNPGFAQVTPLHHPHNLHQNPQDAEVVLAEEEAS